MVASLKNQVGASCCKIIDCKIKINFFKKIYQKYLVE